MPFWRKGKKETRKTDKKAAKPTHRDPNVDKAVKEILAESPGFMRIPGWLIEKKTTEHGVDPADVRIALGEVIEKLKKGMGK